MKKLTEEEVRGALALAKEERRRCSALLNQANFYEKTRLLAHQGRFNAKLLEPCLNNQGRNSELESILEQNQIEMRRFLEKQHAAMVKQSPSVSGMLATGWAERRKAVEQRVALGASAPNFNFVILDRPLFVLPSQGINLGSVMLAPWNNSVRFDGEWNTPHAADGTDDVSYVFVWKNTGQGPAVLNVESYLSLNGYCDVLAEPGESYTVSSIIAELGILQYWNSPPTTPTGQRGQFDYVSFLSANGGGIFGVGDYESTGVTGSYDVIYRDLLVPAGGVAVFEVTLQIGHWTNGGFIEVDFASGEFEVVCPAVVLNVQSG